MTNILLREDQFIKPDIVAKAYLRATEYALVHTQNGDTEFPAFAELYEEYITTLIEQKTTMSVSEIDEELKELNRLKLIDVEKGFNPEQFGIEKAAELMNYLMSAGYVFCYDGHVFSHPLQEVW